METDNDMDQQQEQEQKLKANCSSETRLDGDNIYYCYYRFNQIESKKVHMKITELEEESYCKAEETIADHEVTSTKKFEIPIQFERSKDQAKAVEPGDYVVEEPDETPFDFVFEPDHYQSGHRHNEHCKVHSDTLSTCSSMSSTSNGATRMEDEEVPSGSKNGKRKLEESSLQEPSAANRAGPSSSYPVNRAARFKGEKDGILEYEYLSHRYTKPPPAQQIHLDEHSSETDQLNHDYYSEFDIKHHHLNAVIRGVSLVKWPDVGFGFGITKSTDQTYYYVNEIKANSPAEFSLQVGDIIIEIDEMCPGKDFGSLDDIYEHLNRSEFIHLLVIHESKYFNLNLAPSKSQEEAAMPRSFYDEYEDLLKNFCINCQDIVVVSWPKEKGLTN